MEHCLRVAVCLVLFLTYLQARPFIIIDDLGLDSLIKDVSCENMTFTSPPNVQNCRSAAFECIMGQLKQAATNCTDEKERILNTLEALEEYSDACPQSVQTNSSDCKCENQKSQKPLANFVGDIKTFVQFLNAMP